MIFEEVDHEYFFEIILSTEDLEQIKTLGGILREYLWEGNNIRDINVYIRQEKEGAICHSLKEKKQAAKKGFQRTSKEKCTKANHKSKPLRSLIRKRVAGKKRLPRKKAKSNGNKKKV